MNGTETENLSALKLPCLVPIQECWRAIAGQGQTMRVPFSISLRGRLCALFLVLFGIGLIARFMVLDQERKHAAERAVDLARHLAADFEQRLGDAGALLTGLAVLRVHELSPAECGARLADVRKSYPYVMDLAVLGEQGRTLCATRARSQTFAAGIAVVIEDARASGRFAVSSYRVDENGKPTLVAAMPVANPAGAATQFLSAVLDLDWFNRQVADQAPAGVVVRVLDRAGSFIVRHPNPEGFLGRSGLDLPGIRQALAARTPQVLGEQTWRDGVRRLQADVPLRHPADGVLSVGIPAELLARAADPMLAAGVTLLLILVAASGVFAWFGAEATLLHPLRQLVEAARRIRSGDLTASVAAGKGSIELAELAGEFNAMAAALASREQELRVLATAFETQEGIMITDAGGRIVRVNRGFTQLTGHEAEDVLGKSPAILQSGKQDPAFYRQMWETLERDKYWRGEVWNRRRNGEVYPERLTITAVGAPDGQVTHYVGVFSDITQRKQAEERIHNLAFYDPLTRLPNRRLLHDRLQQAFAASARHGTRGAVFFIDLDHFKTLNDTMGHDLGDLLLVEVAGRLLACVREEDTVARIGGDEFVVMLVNLGESAEQSATQAAVVGDKLLAAISRPYELKGHPHHTTPSVGVGLFHGHEQSVDELLKRADVAMYQAKAAGRGTVRFFDPAMQAALDTRAALESDLRGALERGQLHLYYQTQIDNSRGVIGAEALLRWKHPERGWISPAQFIPLAEESGLIVPIGQWVVETACAQLKRWEGAERTRHLQLAVNVSARQFRRGDFVSRIREALEASGAPPSRLKLELTESMMHDNVSDTIASMNALKRLGVGFSMDDFGTGYSSLSCLKRLPLDQLKIDQSFVRDLVTDPNDAVIVKTIIGMAKSLGLEVIAEGVETEVQRQFLLRLGCRVYQGYLFARPVPVEEFERQLDSPPVPALPERHRVLPRDLNAAEGVT
jgi:diguanylate cyclase (GGDEF)-like protein/PAS domain S-box-containing protein